MRIRNTLKRVRHCIVFFCLVAVGCDSESGSKQTEEPSRAKIKDHWVHSIDDGTPQRMTVLRDETEILTVGHHDHGRFLLLIRYRDEERFSVINDNGEFAEYVQPK